MALSKIQPASMDLTANYAFTGTNSVAGLEYAEKKLATLTASSSSTLSFTSSIDNTYNIYKFRFVNMHPATNQVHFQVGFRDGSTAFDATKTSTAFYAYHTESGSGSGLAYDTGKDLAQSTGVQVLNTSVSNANDSGVSGELFLFDPSSTTFVKHFLSTTNNMQDGDSSEVFHIAGYCNTTTAIDGVQFKMSSGNIDSGTIEMYGIN